MNDHDKTNTDFAQRLLDMPKLAIENQQASPPRPSPVHVFAELGTYAGNLNVQQVPGSTGGSDSGTDGVVCEAGQGPIA